MDDPHVSTSDDSEITLDNAKQPNWLMRNENKHNTSVIQLPERQNHIRKRLPGENYSASQTNTPLLYNSSNAYTYHKDENNVDKQKLNPLNTTLLPSSTSRSQSPMDTTNILPKSKWKSTSSFYFNPSGRIVYSWCGVISVVFMYHLWVIMYRFAFNEINQQTVIFWLTLDYFADLLYLIDMTISIRTGFLEDGVMQFDGVKMRSHYLNSSRFYIDCLSLLPLDFLYLSIGYKSILRIFRLCKVYKFWQFMDRAERHANYPNLMRSTKLLLYYLTFLHWNACIFQLFNSTAESVFMLTVTPNSPNSGGATTTASTSTQTTSLGTGSHISHNTTSGSTNNRANNSNHSTVQNNHHGNLTDSGMNNSTSLLRTGGDNSMNGVNTAGGFLITTGSPTSVSATLGYVNSNMIPLTSTTPQGTHLFREIQSSTDNHGEYEYLHAFYWSMLSLFPVGGFPTPNCPVAYFYLICEGVIGMFLMATVLGHVSNIVTNVSTAQKEFQARLDSVKNYMTLRRVPAALQERVINWFDFLWYTNKITDEDKVLQNLPYKLKAEIAIHVHLNTLKQVEIFQDTEEGFLSELVLKLRVVLFAPGDYVCRKGEIGKQMYIVNRGKLHVLGDDGHTVLATLHAGSYFGELSILNLGNNGNRRTASVRSLGYSDLFCLSKSDLWEVLKEYPNARSKLEADAYKKMNQYQNIPQQNTRDFPAKSLPYERKNLNISNTLNYPSCTSVTFENILTNTTHPTGNQINQSHLFMNSNHDCLLRVSNSDGSDGYGSDPSRCSAFLSTPQRSPTPPAISCANNSDNANNITSNHSTCPLSNFTLPNNITNHNQSAFFDIHENLSSSATLAVSSSVPGNSIPFHSNENQQVFNTSASESHQYSWLKSCPPNSTSLGKQRNLSMPTDLFHVAKNTSRSNSNQLRGGPNMKSPQNPSHNFYSNQSKRVENDNLCHKYYNSNYPMKEEHLSVVNYDNTMNGQRVIPVICFEKASTPSVSEATVSEDEQEFPTVYEQHNRQLTSPNVIKFPPSSSTPTSSPMSLKTLEKNCIHLKLPKHKTSNWIGKRPPWPYNKGCSSYHYKSHGLFKTGHHSYTSSIDNPTSTFICQCKTNNNNNKQNSQELIEHLNQLNYRINKLENDNFALQNCLLNQSASSQQLHPPSTSPLLQHKQSLPVNLTRKHSLPVKPLSSYQQIQEDQVTPPTTSPSIVINENLINEYRNLKELKVKKSQSNMPKRQENGEDVNGDNLDEKQNPRDDNSPVFTLD